MALLNFCAAPGGWGRRGPAAEREQLRHNSTADAEREWNLGGPPSRLREAAMAASRPSFPPHFRPFMVAVDIQRQFPSGGEAFAKSLWQARQGRWHFAGIEMTAR